MIQVTEGMDNLNPPTEAEQTTLLPEEVEQGVRLACQCRVQSGRVTVERADGAI
jgi:ferredoxin